MKDGQKLWTRNELVLAINLYCKLPFGKLDRNTKEVKGLARLIGRTPNAVALKLVNFSSLDPSLKARGIKGMGNTSSLDKKVWAEFYNNWDAALIDSEELLAKENRTSVAQLNKIDFTDLPNEGKEKERLVSVRVNQCVFRSIILATYDNSCCITGINNTELLIASHIVPWSKDEKNRLNPMNGICLNALHDKAFDCGLITISAENYSIKVSSKLKNKNAPNSIAQSFLNLEGTQIKLPSRFLPGMEFLKIHNDFFKS
ncbi:MAG: HNH endonuclease [Chitinophagaceae bacterium]